MLLFITEIYSTLTLPKKQQMKKVRDAGLIVEDTLVVLSAMVSPKLVDLKDRKMFLRTLKVGQSHVRRVEKLHIFESSI